MSKEDTANLKAEIRSELKDYVAILREEGLPLDEIETKMLAMMEEFMRTSSSRIGNPLEENLPILEANPRMDTQNAGKEVGSKRMTDCLCSGARRSSNFRIGKSKRGRDGER